MFASTVKRWRRLLIRLEATGLQARGIQQSRRTTTPSARLERRDPPLTCHGPAAASCHPSPPPESGTGIRMCVCEPTLTSRLRNRPPQLRLRNAQRSSQLTTHRVPPAFLSPPPFPPPPRPEPQHGTARERQHEAQRISRACARDPPHTPPATRPPKRRTKGCIAMDRRQPRADSQRVRQTCFVPQEPTTIRKPTTAVCAKNAPTKREGLRLAAPRPNKNDQA